MYSRPELPLKTSLPSPFPPNEVFPAKKPDSYFHNASGMHSQEQLFLPLYLRQDSCIWAEKLEFHLFVFVKLSSQKEESTHSTSFQK